VRPHLPSAFFAVCISVNTNQGELSRLKRLKPEHRTCHPLHSSMILLNNLMQRFHLTDHGSGAVLLVVALEGCCSGLAAINRDRLGTPFRRIAFFRNRNTASLSRRAVSKQSIVWPCLSTTRDKYRHSPFLYNPFFSPQNWEIMPVLREVGHCHGALSARIGV
jgi:hypothetical protein